ncbi:zinc-ribbon domain-containing protein [Thalassococcus sp. CAU 1522]|uniref:Zinc-ribbon domain-containing protein n=1 Tax=Thalassococcus arenae TaxID=2851652 RepID=A0ABS6N867_9RHOB|nr:zinc-ribbon domain-containing protein [Thalassococcus arenae]MBV2360218.1 zinc-ribbon domain-containing protein [Thalassococcus arenae]
MRLICPNCGAQYEVPSEVIPEGGRDVQCSNCGHTWFQRHPDDDPALAEELGEGVPDTSWEPEPDDGPDPASIAAPRPDPRSEARPPAQDPQDAATPAPTAPVQKRGLDPEVAEVLREEAELEKRRRAAEAAALESQPDLGLAAPDEDEAARRAREARERMARMRGEAGQAAPQQGQTSEPGAGRRAAEAAAAAAAGSRRDLLPDVEEINQTLRASSEPRLIDTDEGRETVGDVDQPRRSGFARGFALVLVLAVIGLAVYVSAPQIKASVPQAAPYVDGYVAAVDAARVWLDERVMQVMRSLDQMSSEATSQGTDTTPPASE